MSRWTRAERNLFRLLAVLALVSATWLAVAPVEQVPTAHWNDKLVHLLAFAVLAGLVDFGWVRGPFVTRGILLLGYGLFIELLQYGLPHRSFELLDLAADGLGILFYLSMVPLLRRLPWLSRRWA
ncbi:VanZ family protein [Alkalilimnicola sp. S0819]|uniref:VanZ family protein n=1 Tax=Alkalilimnicola sp. S0819 TaxID=2613922 RepID=UPI0012617B31|nr:VanZ family protein [Alkalilimnicola sp. S0819]KAB7623942.1 VanZ family protein [Alkalilimnicola sp. S0819]MPQ16540.1 VanZ family protein [Alkalilimnicola sp. S0819]